jgi:hypothetical protein
METVDEVKECADKVKELVEAFKPEEKAAGRGHRRGHEDEYEYEDERRLRRG